MISSGAVGAICTLVGTWIKSKVMQKHAAETKIPQPCGVNVINDCVSVKECNRRMKELDERLTRCEAENRANFAEVRDLIKEMDRKSEDRAISLHHKMDAIANSVSATGGKVELIERQVFKR